MVVQCGAACTLDRPDCNQIKRGNGLRHRNFTETEKLKVRKIKHETCSFFLFNIVHSTAPLIDPLKDGGFGLVGLLLCNKHYPITTNDQIGGSGVPTIINPTISSSWCAPAQLKGNDDNDLCCVYMKH